MFGQWGKRADPSPTSAALRSTMGQFQNMGVNIATKYRPPPSPSLSHKSPSRLPVSKFRNTARAVGVQPFDLSGGGGRGRKSPQMSNVPGSRFKSRAAAIGHQPFGPGSRGGGGTAAAQMQMQGARGGEFFVKKAKQVAHQPFPLGSFPMSSGPITSASDLFALKARQIGHQPFNLVIHPPSPVRQVGSRLFKNKANQIAHQPFGLAGRAPVVQEPAVLARINYFKKKAKSIGFMASQPLFKKTIEEEAKKYGRFKSFCKAITRTRRMLVSGRLDVIEEEQSNEAEIQAGTFPMLKKEIVVRLFEFLPVQDLKNARLVCEFWKRFATPSLQRKSMVYLNGNCDICKSEWMSADPNIEPHEHTETISFYRFVLFLLEYPSDRRYYLPFRNFKIMNLNLYFIAGLNTEPTRVFLMFLKIFAEKVTHLHLQNVQLCPPNAFYKFLDCMKRMNSIIFDGMCIWLDPLNPDASDVGFQMNINQYVHSITFCTNWIGEELLHWQMIFQAFPCLQELNLIDVSKSEINHCLAALINLPEDEEEEEEMRLTGGFKKLSRQIMLVPCDDEGGADSDEAFGPLSRKSFRQLTRLMINTPFNINRLNQLQKIEKTNPGKFKKFARGVAFNPFPLTGMGRKRSLQTSQIPNIRPVTGTGGFGGFKKFAKGLTRQPFSLAAKPPVSLISQRRQDPKIQPIFEASMKGAARRFMIINQPFLMRKLKGGQVRVKELKPGDHSQPSFKKSARKLQLLEQFFGQMAAMEEALEEEEKAEEERQRSASKSPFGSKTPEDPEKLKKETASKMKKSALSAWAAPPPKPGGGGGKMGFPVPPSKSKDSKGKDSPSQSGKDSPSVASTKGKDSPSVTSTKGKDSPAGLSVSGKDTPDTTKERKSSASKSRASPSDSDAKGKDSPSTGRDSSASKSKDREGSSKKRGSSSSKMTDALKDLKTRPSSKTSSKGKDSPSLKDALSDLKDKDKERPSSKSSSSSKTREGCSKGKTDLKDAIKDLKEKERPSSKSSSTGKDSPSLADAVKRESSSKSKDKSKITDALKDLKEKERPSSKSSSKGKDSPSLADAVKRESSSKSKDKSKLTDAVKDLKEKERPSSKSSSKGKDSPSLADAVKRESSSKRKDSPSIMDAVKSSSKGKDSPSPSIAETVKSSSKGKDSPSPSVVDAVKSSSKGKDSPSPSIADAVKKESSSKGKDSPSLLDAVKRESSSKSKEKSKLTDAVKDLKEKERPSSKSSSKGKDSPSLKDAVKRESSSKGKDSPLKDAVKELKEKERPSSKSSSKGKDSPSLADAVKKESSSKRKDSPSLLDAVKRESSSKSKDKSKITDAVKELKDKERPSSKSSSKGKDSPSMKDAVKSSSSKGKDSPKLTDALSQLKKDSSSSREGSSKDRKSSGKTESSSDRKSSGKTESSSDRKSSGKRESSSDRKSSGKRESSSERKSSGKKEGSSSDRKSSASSSREKSAKKEKSESPSQIKSPSPIKEVPEPGKDEKAPSPVGSATGARGTSPKGGGAWGVGAPAGGASGLAQRAFSPGGTRALSPTGTPGRIPRAISPEKAPSRLAGMLKRKAKQIMMQPFRLASGIGIKGEKKKFDGKGRFKRRARLIINQPFTLVTNPPEREDIKFEAMGMKTQIKKIATLPFQPKPEEQEDEYEPPKPDPDQPPKTPLELFREKVKLLRNQPFKFEPKARPKVLAGSMLYKINISCRRNFEDQLKLDLGLPNESDDSDDSDDTLAERFIADMDGDSDSEDDDSTTSDESSIHETDFEHFDVNELLAEVVARFGITNLTLRVNYTKDDCVTFPIVLEACQEKIQILHLIRPSKIYFSELGMQFRSCPFETPQETSMEFPCIKKLSIAHNLIDNIDEIKASFPALKNLTINVVWTEFLVRNMKPYKTYVKTNLMLSMKHGKPNESIKILTWNIEDARHPYTQKRTVVYKSNALRHMPRVFPNLSKLSVSITTAHELHVIFRECTQLHDLIVLKNSFYRIKDEDIIGVEEESSDEELPLEYELEIEDEFKNKKAQRVRTLHPTRIKNGGIKQLKFLRRLSLENNNYCLTNDSVEHGFIHLRRLRSLHISRGKRITIWALRLLRQCRFLVHVNVTKSKLKALRLPMLADGEVDEPDLSRLSDYQKLQYQKYMNPDPTAFQDPGIYITEDQMETQLPEEKIEYATTKYDKLGGKKFQYVTTSYEVNGRRYELVRRKYEYDDERDCKIWAKRVRLAEIRRQKDEEAAMIAEFKKSQEIDPDAIIWRAEKKRESELQDQESDYERFINDYDSDESIEEGYCDADEDNDDDLPPEDRRMLDHGRSSESEWNDDEDDDGDDDGNCPEADTMYEADKEHYQDTNGSTSNESNCDSDFSLQSELRRKRRANRAKRGKHGKDSSDTDADDSDDDFKPRNQCQEDTYDTAPNEEESLATAVHSSYPSTMESDNKENHIEVIHENQTHKNQINIINSKNSRRNSKNSDKLTATSTIHSSNTSSISVGTKTSQECKEIIAKLTQQMITDANIGSEIGTTLTTSSSGTFPADHSIISTSSPATSKSQLLKAKMEQKQTSKKDKDSKDKEKNKEKDKDKSKGKESSTKKSKDKESKDKDKDKDTESPTKSKDKKSKKSKKDKKKDKKKKGNKSAGDIDDSYDINDAGLEGKLELNRNEALDLDNDVDLNINQLDSHSNQSDFNFKLQKLYRIGEQTQNAIEINQDCLANERVGIEYNEAMRRISMSTTATGSSQNPQHHYLGPRMSSTTSSELGPPSQGLTFGFGATSSSATGSYPSQRVPSNSYSTTSSGYEGQFPGHPQGQDQSSDRGTAFSTISSSYDYQSPGQSQSQSQGNFPCQYQGHCQGQNRDRGILHGTTSSGYDGPGHQIRDTSLSSATSSGYEGQFHPNQNRRAALSSTSSGYEGQFPPSRGTTLSTTSSGYEGQFVPNRDSSLSATSSGYDGQFIPSRATAMSYDSHIPCHGHVHGPGPCHPNRGTAQSTTSSGYEGQDRDRALTSATSSTYDDHPPQNEHEPSFRVISSTLGGPQGGNNHNRLGPLPLNANHIHGMMPYSSSSCSSIIPGQGRGTSFSNSSSNLSQLSRNRNLQALPLDRLPPPPGPGDLNLNDNVNEMTKPSKDPKKKKLADDKGKGKGGQSHSRNGERKRRKSEKEKDGRRSKNKNKKGGKKERSKSRGSPEKTTNNERGKNCRSVGDNDVKPTATRSRRDRSNSKPRLPDLFRSNKEVENRLSELRQSLITKMVKDVKKERRK